MALKAITLAALALASLLAVVALELALMSQPEQGVSLAAGGAIVDRVEPGGRAWALGVRAGQPVMEFDPGRDIVEWRLTTGSVDDPHPMRYSALLSSLRGSLLNVALAAVLLVLAALLFRRTRLAGALAVLAVVALSVPLVLSGNSAWVALGILATVLAPAIWLALAAPWSIPTRWIVAAIALVVAVAWAWTRWREPALYDAADTLRFSGAIVATGLVGVAGMEWPRTAGATTGAARLPVLPARDLVVAGLLATGLVLGVAFFHLSLPFVPLLVAAAIALYPPWRNAVLHTVDRLLLGDVREQAAIAAIEDERARVSRDIHDAPLQELAAIIRRLERIPDAAPEADAVRAVADHLRRIVSDLRPPMLDDLGLGPALGYLVDRSRGSIGPDGPRLELAIETEPVLGGQRPPTDVELACFRIAQEAIANALAHARATEVRLAARIEPQQVTLSVTDDGVGVTPQVLRSAERNGHIGIPSLRQRAAAIGARIAIEPTEPHGTRVALAWSAES